MAIALAVAQHDPAGLPRVDRGRRLSIVDSARVLLRRNPRGTSAAVEGLAEILRRAFAALSAPVAA
jgi:hypothetical protein